MTLVGSSIMQLLRHSPLKDLVSSPRRLLGHEASTWSAQRENSDGFNTIDPLVLPYAHTRGVNSEAIPAQHRATVLGTGDDGTDDTAQPTLSAYAKHKRGSW